MSDARSPQLSAPAAGPSTGAAPVAPFEHALLHALTTDAPPPPALLAPLPPQLHARLWSRLRDAVTLRLARRLPQPAPPLPPFLLPWLDILPLEAALLQPQSLDTLRRLAQLESRLAVEALVAWQEQPAQRGELLLRFQAHWGRVGALYGEWARRAGPGVAGVLVEWALRVQRYAASPVVAALLWGEVA